MMNIQNIDCTKELTKDQVDYLAKLVNTVPLPNEWYEISDLLIANRSNYRKVMDRRIELQRIEAKQKEAAMTEEERQAEAAKWKRIKEDMDPNQFHGNMGQPETPEEYKWRYGVWPLKL